MPVFTTVLTPLSMTPYRLSSRLSPQLTTVFIPVMTVLTAVLTPRRAGFQVFMLDADKSGFIDATELGATMTRMTVFTTDDCLHACYDCLNDCLNECLDVRCLWSSTRTSQDRLTPRSSAPP